MDRKLQGRNRVQIRVLLALPAIIAVIIVLWLKGFFLPSWIIWNRSSEEGIPEGVKKKLESSWLVQDALNFDINGDGSAEWLLLVWKRGSYGKHRPSWVKRDEIGFSQHIFIYSEREDGWHAIWMSSKLEMKAATFLMGKEIPGTGRRSLDIVAPDKSVSSWGWLSWGLQRVNW